MLLQTGKKAVLWEQRIEHLRSTPSLLVKQVAGGLDCLGDRILKPTSAISREEGSGATNHPKIPDDTMQFYF